MIAGSKGPGEIEFDHPQVATIIGDFALTLILFAGGLDTNRLGLRDCIYKSRSSPEKLKK
ncbi:hypothetical protein M595_0971 [Lyngbya aestuarii BL J]|uniref:Uncharacterized protein n=1 Tax=Lyngbya aestuarii BL J TaxID=1348334 RepID=U7QLZ5_9CYAN|nr:hypothetical protein [Lyngbya aestuarii]ERT08984.1 hypothetical protein M595_0971 [Lyngbya aestuarii BL J]